MQKRVLIIEDDPGVAKLLCVVCEKAGYRVVSLSSGEAALTFLGAESVDLVLLDFTLPDIDGSELLGRIRAASPDLPVVFVTGRVLPEELALLRESGATAVVKKPFTRNDVLASLSAYT